MSPETAFAAHPDLQRAIIFHGHFCQGLAVGYRAAEMGLALLGSNGHDDQVVAIVENNSCAIDAIQAISGCTFGKGNLIFRDYGKHVYTFVNRQTGQGVRLSLRLADPPGRDDAGRDEQTQRIMNAAAEELFAQQPLTMVLPIHPDHEKSVCCPRCGEPVAGSHAVRQDGQMLCRPCAGYR